MTLYVLVKSIRATMTFYCLNRTPYNTGHLTFIEDLEATVGSAVVGGEKHVQEVTAAEQELRHQGPIE